MTERLHEVVRYHLVNTLEWTSLRPTQMAAIDPILRGDDVLLLAPTAGGKTEAAFFPLLSRLAAEHWEATSVLYVSPLRALLNNLAPRLESYCGWLGYSAGVRHGDTTRSARRRLIVQRPDVLLTTPESLEAMLVSPSVDPGVAFAALRAVVVDEVHAFAGDDRGWHLLAVLERVTRLAGHPLQRIGLSATIGNPEDLLSWLQGGGGANRSRTVVSPEASPGTVELQLDYVGNLVNAATVIASLHQGEKRLVFAESRGAVEELAVELRRLGIETFVSHSSLAVAERHRAEAAFTESRNCVIVSTSTLELGIDVGDLDRVIQVDAPGTVASLLQRLGRSGRRQGTSRNILMLATEDDALLQSAGLVLLLGEGYVEPVTPPPSPRHVAAQQLLALCLQQGRVGEATWPEWLGGLDLASPTELAEITDWLCESGHLDRDEGMLFIGRTAERRFGARNFMDLLSVFTSPPQFILLHGRIEIGSIDPMTLTRKTEGPRLLILGGHSWEVKHIDWRRRRAFVEPAESKGRTGWPGFPRPLSYEVTNAMRRILLGAEPRGALISRRARARLAVVRATGAQTVDAEATVIADTKAGRRWWTWAGAGANAVLAAGVARANLSIVADSMRYENRYLILPEGVTSSRIATAISAMRSAGDDGAGDAGALVTNEALTQLRFSELLPRQLAAETLARRASDWHGAEETMSRPIIQRPAR